MSTIRKPSARRHAGFALFSRAHIRYNGLVTKQTGNRGARLLRWELPAILLAFSLLVGLTSWAVPPFEGPDGPEHFAYVLWLAAGKSFPPQGAAAWDTPLRQEASQPPLYYALAALTLRLAGAGQFDRPIQRNPHFPSDAPGYLPDNKNVVIHDPQRPAWEDGWGPVYLARLVSWVSGLILLAAVYGLARETAPETPLVPHLATLAVALNPQIIFQSSVVSNDIAAAAASAVTLWLWARLLRRGATAGRGLALGAAFGLAALAKTNALALAPPLALGWFWLLWRKPHARKRTLSAGLLAAAAALIVGGWWYVRSWWVLGSPLGLNTHCYAIWAYCGDPTRRPDALAQWREVYYSFWAAFGWGNIKPPGWVYGVLSVCLLPAFYGWTRLIKQWPRRRQWQPTSLLLLLLALVFLLQIGALELWMRQVTAPHGRLLFPAVGAVAIWLAFGWRAAGRFAPLPLLLALVALAAGSWWGLIRPAYAPPTHLSPAAAAALAQPLGWRFDDLAVLTGAQPLADSTAAGETLPLRLCWHTLAQSIRDKSVFVQLVGPQNEVVASRRTYPGLGGYPTSRWDVGVDFCDVVRVEIPADLPRSLLYQVEVGLIDNVSGERLAVFSPAGEPRADQFATRVLLRAREVGEEMNAGTSPLQLQSATFDTHWQPGSHPTVTLTWALAQPVSLDYTIYVHLRPAAGDANVAQADAPPVDGWYPTSYWLVGEPVRDTHTFALPANIPPGPYQLFAGWYDPVSGSRLGTEFFLGDITVQGPP